MLTNASFDALANTYDTDFTHSLIGSMQRKVVWKFTEEQLIGKKELSILEINCGTGEDAVWLAKKGHQVLATDISKDMVDIAEQKANQQQLKVKTVVCSFSDLENKLVGQKFDVIFSNFGGLNCANANELKQLNIDFSKLLKPNGKLIMVLLGKKCFLEKLYFLFRFDFKKMNRRKKEASAYLSPDNFISTWYFNYQEIRGLFTQFNLTKKKPIGLFIPPSYLEPLLQKNKLFLPIIKLLDKTFGNISFLANYGDHIFITLEKKQ